MSQRPPYYSIALLSAAALAYEILLMRLFSIIQWHHFAYMIIALALLGYGLSGTIVTMARKAFLPRYRLIYVSAILCFAIFSVASFLLAQKIPFNAEEILWDGRQVFNLILIFILLTVPFLFAASAICLAFMYFPNHVARLYAMDLIGAGIGSLAIILMLYFVFPQVALLIIGIAGIVATLIAGWELQISNRAWATVITLSFISFLLLANHTINLRLSPYKSLVQTLRISGSQVIQEKSSPLGLLTVVASKDVPFRHAPGLSLYTKQEPPAQLGIFTDGDNMTVITQLPDNYRSLTYLDQLTSALPYHLNRAQQVLIVGAGGGADILQAKFHAVSKIDAIEINPQMVNFIKSEYREFAGSLYQQDNVNIHVAEVRDFLSHTPQSYDLIQLALVDSFNASASGLYALNESYLYTTEALQLYLEHLKPGGYLALTRWIKLPPRDTLKLFNTAIDGLKKTGVTSPEKQLVLIRSWQTSTLLIKKGFFTSNDIAAIRSFCADRAFDIAFYPGIKQHEANQYNKLKQPIFYQATTSLLGENRENFLNNYKFNLQVATDDRPYFHHFFKWSTWPEIFRLRSQGGMSLIEWGYITLLLTLIVALALSSLLIISPLFFFRQKKIKLTNNVNTVHVLVYFFLIGLAFLFLEIAFMQKFIQFLGHPIYAISGSLTTFLVFAGIGSHWSGRFKQERQKTTALRIAISGIAVLSFSYTLLFETFFIFFSGLAISIKMLLCISLIAPLAFFMGIPFPTAMASLAKYANHLVPWAWGINGCASVVSAVLATLLAIHTGFSIVIYLGILLYISIIFFYPSPNTESHSKNIRP